MSVTKIQSADLEQVILDDIAAGAAAGADATQALADSAQAISDSAAAQGTADQGVTDAGNAQAAADAAQAAVDAIVIPTFVYGEVLGGTPNDSTTDFSLANTPAFCAVFKNGLRMNLTEDYTLSGTTVSFVVAPATGAILLADYQY